jgi:hypothetical protein
MMRTSQPNSKSYLVIPFGSAGTELGLLYIRDIMLGERFVVFEVLQKLLPYSCHKRHG